MKRVPYALIVLLLVLTVVGVLAYGEADWSVYLWQQTISEQRQHSGGAWSLTSAHPWELATGPLRLTPTPPKPTPPRMTRAARYTCDQKAAYLKYLVTPSLDPDMNLDRIGGVTRRIVNADAYEVTYEYQGVGYAHRGTLHLACGRQAPDSWFRWFPTRRIEPQKGNPL